MIYLQIIILLLLFIGTYLITACSLLAYTLNNAFRMYNIKLDHLKDILLKKDKEKDKEKDNEKDKEKE